MLLASGSLDRTLVGGEGATVRDTSFSHDRGFHEAPFELTISSATPGAEIRYTTDGRPPSATRGTVYTGPIPVATTTVVRAVAYLEGFQPTNIDTQTYIFLADVIHQPPRPPGLPSRWGEMEADYEMDPDVVEDPRYNKVINEALLAIPTMSIVMREEDLFGAEGIYYNGASEENGEWERAASVELIYPDGRDGFQIDCAIRPHTHVLRKRSFKLLFKAEYGDDKLRFPLFETAPLNAAGAVREFDRLVLRAGTNRSWSNPYNPDDTCYTRDQWARDSQIAMSGIGSHGLFVHLYLNGLYWGVYNPVERPDAWFASAYRGGGEEEWFAINHGGPLGGDASRYERLLELAGRQRLEETARYDLFRQYVDVTQYSDYLILNWYAGTGDWPQNNWYAANRNTGPDGGEPLLYFEWDAEDIFDELGSGQPGRSSDGAWVSPRFRQGAESDEPIARIWQALKANGDYMTLFGDRVYRHCFNGGALAENNARNRWLRLNRHIEKALIAESARWGDALEAEGISLRTVDDHWRPEVTRVANASIRGNAERFIDVLREEGYYPERDPPLFRRHGGVVPPGFQLVVVNPNDGGDVHYTTDGSDPRAAVNGNIAPNASPYSIPIPIERSTIVKARVRGGGRWSALAEASFFTPADLVKLRITEIMYHHPEFQSVDGDQYEFIELKNTGERELDLSGVHLSEGVSHSFPFGARLGPGEFAVLVSNPERFALLHPDVAVAGVYDGQLANGGERLTLSDSEGNVLTRVDFKDAPPWPEQADGDGYSLVPVSPNPVADQDDVLQWTRSGEFAGSPGADEGAAFPAPPRIARQPQDVIVAAGDPALFAVWALGEPQPTYQWLVDGRAMDGATDWYHVVESVSSKDHGLRFRCRVSNEHGSVESDEATLLVDTPRLVSGELVSAGAAWRYFKGTEEASSPRAAWRLPSFDASGWAEGAAPFGYGEPGLGTVLDDMKNNYSSVYLRRKFQVPSGVNFTSLGLNVDFDDGFVVWLNGTEVARSRAPVDELAHDALATRNHEAGEFEAFSLPQPSAVLVPGENIIAVQAFNVLIDSSDFKLELVLGYEGLAPPTGNRGFVRGDSNGDGRINISDSVNMLLVSFLGLDASDCEDAGDVNDDGLLNITDPIVLLGHLFLGGLPPPEPFPAPGLDTTEDDLGCKRGL